MKAIADLVERLRDWHHDVTRDGYWVGHDVEAQQRTDERVKLIADAAKTIERLQSLIEWHIRLTHNDGDGRIDESQYGELLEGIRRGMDQYRTQAAELAAKVKCTVDGVPVGDGDVVWHSKWGDCQVLQTAWIVEPDPYDDQLSVPIGECYTSA